MEFIKERKVFIMDNNQTNNTVENKDETIIKEEIKIQEAEIKLNSNSKFKKYIKIIIGIIISIFTLSFLTNNRSKKYKQLKKEIEQSDKVIKEKEKEIQSINEQLNKNSQLKEEIEKEYQEIKNNIKENKDNFNKRKEEINNSTTQEYIDWVKKQYGDK